MLVAVPQNWRHPITCSLFFEWTSCIAVQNLHVHVHYQQLQLKYQPIIKRKHVHRYIMTPDIKSFVVGCLDVFLLDSLFGSIRCPHQALLLELPESMAPTHGSHLTMCWNKTHGTFVRGHYCLTYSQMELAVHTSHIYFLHKGLICLCSPFGITWLL